MGSQAKESSPSLFQVKLNLTSWNKIPCEYLVKIPGLVRQSWGPGIAQARRLWNWSTKLFDPAALDETYPWQPGSSGTLCKNLSSCLLKTSSGWFAILRIFRGSTLNNLGPLTFKKFSLIVPILPLCFNGGILHLRPCLPDQYGSLSKIINLFLPL